MKYNEAYNKIIEAYFNDEIEPYDSQFCFCGSLAGGENWKTAGYSNAQLRKMEAALLETIHGDTIGFIGKPVYVTEMFTGMAGDHLAYYETQQENGSESKVKSHPNYESALFGGMVKALEVLKQIHIERGEVIDETPAFTKRQLQPA